MSAIHDHTALQLAALIRSRKLSPLEVMEHFLDRATRFDRRLGCFITLTADQALTAAAIATERLRSADPESLPALFGVPVAVKDLSATAGVRTTLGSAALHDLVPTQDDHVVAMLKAAGTISIGKTNTPEFGVACYTSNDLGPAARTPWDESRSAAGSSGGAAAAVAAGLLPLAHGSDAGGSIRTPAAACGLVGFKPSRGAISSAPRLNWLGFGTEGALAHTVADAAALLEALSPGFPADPLNQPPPPGSFLAALDRPPANLRIARVAATGGGDPVNPEVTQVWEKASKTLAELGHEVVDIEPPDSGVFEDLIDSFLTTMAVSVAFLSETVIAPERRPLMRPLSQRLAELGAQTSALDLQRAQVTLMAVAAKVLHALEPYDALLTPTTTDLPNTLDWLQDEDAPAVAYRQMAAWSAFTPAYNVTGQPAVSLPFGVSTSGLPVAIQLVGRRLADDQLVALAAQLEDASPWRGRCPAIWDEH
jgi:amidase